MFDPGQKFRFEKPGCKPRNFVLLDPRSSGGTHDLTDDERRQHVATSSNGDVVFLRNTKSKGLAAIFVDWLRGGYTNVGQWVAVTK